MKTKKIVGMDLGFMQTKVADDEYSIFPSLIGNPSAFEIDEFYLEKEPLLDLELEYENERYYVGARAKDTNNARLCIDTIKTDSINEKIIYRACLGILTSKMDKLNISVVTGLPVEDFKQVGLKQSLVSNMKGEFCFSFRGNDVEILVDDVIVIPQSAGAYYDYVLDNNGSVKPEVADTASGVVIIIDVGYKTTDVVTMINGIYDSKRSFTLVKGMRDIHKELARLIRYTYNRKFSLHEIDDLCKSKYFMDCGSSVDISNSISRATKPIAEAILTEINATIGDTRTANLVLGAGGSIALLESYFSNYYSTIYKTSENKELANAAGYKKYGLMRNESNI